MMKILVNQSSVHLAICLYDYMNLCFSLYNASIRIFCVIELIQYGFDCIWLITYQYVHVWMFILSAWKCVCYVLNLLSWKWLIYDLLVYNFAIYCLIYFTWSYNVFLIHFLFIYGPVGRLGFYLTVILIKVFQSVSLPPSQ